MTLADITTRINFLTGTTPTEYSAASRLVSLNKWYNQVHTWILQSMDEWHYDDTNSTDFPVITTDLVGGQQDYGGLGTENMIKVRRVEVSYDGSNWVKATPLDLNQDGQATDTTSIAGDFSQSNPYYRMMANSILLYPIPDADVTDGIRMFIDRSVNEFTADDVTTGTAKPGFDINFHDILPLGVAYDYNSAKRDDKSLMNDIMALKFDLIRQYSTKLKDRKYMMTPNIEDYS
jgi:hypothetical protein